MGPNAVFLASRGTEDEAGTELWRTDGTEAGTELLRTFLSSDIQVLGSNGRVVFLFVAWPDAYPKHPGALWRTDGTAEGTFALTPTLTFFENTLMHRGALVFSACLGEADCEPWVSDGTAAGTRKLRDITPGDYGSAPREFLPVGDRLYFLATAPDGPGLWQTDLTRPGTRRVALLPPSSIPRDLKAAGERLFFILGRENSLWTSDGTAEGTRPVPPFDRPRGRGPSVFGLLGAVGEAEFFSGIDPALGVQVYRTDGTPGGTRRLTSFPKSQVPAVGGVALGDRLLFVGPDSKLWVSDGTQASTHRLQGCAGGCPTPQINIADWRYHWVVNGGLAYFTGSVGNESEPWVTDGTPEGTRPLLRVCASSCRPDPILGPVIQGRVLLQADGDLWSTDGTAAGTRKMAEGIQSSYERGLPVAAAGSRLVFAGFDKSAPPDTLVPQLKSTEGTPESERVLDLPLRDGLGSDPAAFTALGDDVLFFTCSGAAGVWRTRGTAETTVRLTDAQTFCDEGRTTQTFAVLNGAAYFLAIGPNDYWSELWRTDGTPEGTRQISHVGPDKLVSAVTVFQGRVLFVAGEYEGDIHTRHSVLWSSDGTEAGSSPLFELPAIDVFSLAAFDGILYFQGENLENFSSTLFFSDGTAAGTEELFRGGGDPRFLHFGGQTFLLESGALWKTDGTLAGTRPVTDTGTIFNILEVAPLGERLYFMGFTYTGSDLYPGIPALFRTDGTKAGTVMVLKLSLDSERNVAQPQFTAVSGALFFVAWDSEHGGELWRTDGTAAGTALVADINPGPLASRISGLTAVGGRLFFTADDGEHGLELWTSDGTAAGTRRISDIAAGPFSSSPRELTAIGNRLFFSADDQEVGREPWALPLDSALKGRGKP